MSFYQIAYVVSSILVASTTLCFSSIHHTVTDRIVGGSVDTTHRPNHAVLINQPHHTVTDRVVSVSVDTHREIPTHHGTAVSYVATQPFFRESNVKTVTNMHTGGRIIAVNDPLHEYSAVELTSFSDTPWYQSTHIHPNPVHVQQASTHVYSSSSSAPVVQAYIVPSAPPLNPTHEKTSLLHDMPNAYYSSFGDEESQLQHSYAGGAYSGSDCHPYVNIAAVTAVTAFVFCSFAMLAYHGDHLMLQAAPNAKQVAYIAYADDDRVVYTDDTHYGYTDDDYVLYNGNTPYHVNNHHHWALIHVHLKHIINNHYHQVTRYRCQGSGCNVYGWGEFYLAVGIVGMIATGSSLFCFLANIRR